jgi:TPR repeat protein
MDKKLATKWYQKAAWEGVAPAQYQLGLLHEEEGGIEELSLAYCWLHAALQRGETKAHTAMNRIAAQLTQEERDKALDTCWE